MNAPLLSLIVPARDEARRIGDALRPLSQWRDCEVVVAIDPGGSDDTELAAGSFPDVRVVRSAEPGRGATLAAGARAASGRYLLFLHADSRVVERAVRDGIEMLGSPVVAVAFRIRLQSPRRVFRLIEAGINLRARLLAMPYGDQGLLVSRRDYDRVGGFRPYGRCEDVDLVLRLRRLGRLAIADGPCVTSTRRWDRDGVVSVTIDNVLTLIRFLATRKDRTGDNADALQTASEHRERHR